MTDQICYILLTNVFPDQMCSSVVVLVEENPFLDAYTFTSVNRFFAYRNCETPPCTADGYWWFCGSEATPHVLNTGSSFNAPFHDDVVHAAGCKKCIWNKRWLLSVVACQCTDGLPWTMELALCFVHFLLLFVPLMCVFAGIIMIFDGTFFIRSGCGCVFVVEYGRHLEGASYEFDTPNLFTFFSKSVCYYFQ